MSLVGPRPERPELLQNLAHAIPLFEERMRDVKPGITGLAQISLGYTGSIPEGSEIGKLASTLQNPWELEEAEGSLADDMRIKLLYDLAYTASPREVRYVPPHRARHHLQDAARDAEDDPGSLTGPAFAGLRPRPSARAGRELRRRDDRVARGRPRSRVVVALARLDELGRQRPHPEEV